MEKKEEMEEEAEKGKEEAVGIFKMWVSPGTKARHRLCMLYLVPNGVYLPLQQHLHQVRGEVHLR